MYDRIVVPLDGSELAEQVLPQVETIALALQAEVVLLRITEPTLAYLNGLDTYVSADLYQQILDADTAVANDYLKGVAGRLEAAGVRHSLRVEFGQAASVIIDTAKESPGSTLVMMTTHGRTGLARFALGSVAELIVREAAVPVYLVRALGAQPEKVDSILVPLDGSTVAEAVLPSVESLAKGLNASVFLLRSQTGEDVNEAVDYLISVADRLRSAGISDVSTRVRPGPPDEAIVETAGKEGVSMIAMATHGRTGLRRWALGSVSDRVVHTAELPTLLVRGEE